MSELIIIRGNSGSGKSTVAKQLQREMGKGTMLIQQDVVRREILWVRETAEHNPSPDLMEQMVRFGQQIHYNVILEGILTTKKHGDWLTSVASDWDGPVRAYYFDLPFEETLRRHATKPNAHEFGEVEMREWWHDHDTLGWANETIIDHQMSQDAIVEMMLRHRGGNDAAPDS